MAVTYEGAGTQQNNTGASATVAWPTHQADDIAILVCESTGGAAALTAPTNWTKLSDLRDLSTVNGSRVHVWARRATSASMTDPTVPISSDHKVCRIHLFRGVDASITMASLTVATGGDGANFGTAAVSTAVLPTITSTADNSMIVLIASRPNDDASTTHFGTPSNGNLSSISAGDESGTTDGNGGGFVVANGIMATAGATGTTSISKSSSTIGTYTVVVLPPRVDGTATPTAVALSATVPAPTASGGATTEPAAVALAVSTPDPTATGGAGAVDGTATPAAVEIAATTPAPTATGGAATSPAVVTATLTIPAPTVTGGATTSPAAVALTVTASAATVSGGATTSPAAVALAVSTPSPTVTGGATTSPAAVALLITTPDPTATGGAGGDGIATPTAVTLSVTIAAPTATGGAATSPAAVALTASTPDPAATGGATTSPNAVTLTVTIPAPTAAGGATTSPAALLLLVVTPDPTATGGDAVVVAAFLATVTRWREPQPATYREPGPARWREPQAATYREPPASRWREPQEAT